MEGDSINDTDEEKRPMGAAFRDFDVAAVVDGEEDVRGSGKLRQCVAESERIGGLDQHKRHGGAKQDDVRVFVKAQNFAFEVSAKRKSTSTSIAPLVSMGCRRADKLTLPKRQCTALHISFAVTIGVGTLHCPSTSHL